jgi:nucleoside-diphosphate-sugar epimerase
MKKIIIFGASGGLGSKLVPFLKEKYEVVPMGKIGRAHV